MKRMVAEALKPKMGRPRKFEGEPFRLQLLISPDMYRGAEAVRKKRRRPNLPDTIRELLHEAIEAQGIVVE